MRKILITRPEDRAKHFVRQILDKDSSLEDKDFTIDPVIEIVQIPFNTPSMDEYDAVILTSVNSAKALSNIVFDGVFFCVGVATAEVVKKRRKDNKIIEGKDGRELIDKMKEYAQRQQLHFLYFRGKKVSISMKKALEEAGHKVDETICYDAQARRSLKIQTIQDIEEGRIGAVTFFSKRSAAIFMQHAEEAGLITHLRRIQALCISDGVVECLHSDFEKVHVCKQPDAAGMMELIQQYCRRAGE